ncbi:hypothetical protein [Phyllobacterium ifriqiyense]|uniref:hypothetical protein n=1 Tax=Phyllobacterium ifriqiyense TaxID=314238 RepID=UPI0033987B2C
MVGITLSSEQIKSAPTEVRIWLEHEIAVSLGPDTGPSSLRDLQQLVSCSAKEAETLYATVQGMFPVVNVFFELGREGVSIGQEGVEAYRLVDMLRHTRLSGMQQLGACLQMIDQTFRDIHSDNEAALLIIDPRGICIVTAETQRSILALWTQIVATQRITQSGAAEKVAATFAQPSTPFMMSGTVPPSSIHLDGAVTAQPSFDKETTRP